MEPENLPYRVKFAEPFEQQFHKSSFTNAEKIFRSKIFIERISALEHSLLISIPANFLCATAVFIGLLHSINIKTLGVWYAVSIVISFLRLGLSRWYFKDFRHPKFHYKLFILATALAAAVWGYAGSILIPQDVVLDQMILIVIIAGITAGSLQSLQASFLASALFIILIILPLSIWLLIQGGRIYLILGVAMSTYLIFMLIIAQHNFRSFITTLKLRYQNLALVESLEDANKKLEYLSSHDILTGLPNRGSFDLLCDQALARAERNNKKLAILFIDLDYFKAVNDKLGHPAGDQLLTKVAERLKNNIRQSDTVARIGGDEFVVILEEIVNKESVEKIVKTFFKKFEQPFFIFGHQLSMNISVGISIYPEDGKDKKTLLKSADDALYHAKKAGRNRHEFFSSQIDAL